MTLGGPPPVVCRDQHFQSPYGLLPVLVPAHDESNPTHKEKPYKESDDK